MLQSQRNFLRRIRDAGESGIPLSSIGAAGNQLLVALETCGAVLRQGSGRGVVARLADRAAFNAFVNCHCASGLDSHIDDAVDRTMSVQLFGDAKVAKASRMEGVFVRSVNSAARIIGSDGASVAVAELTAQTGGAALVLNDDAQWSTAGTVAVIENTEAFWMHHLVLPDVDLAIFACGRISDRVLNWFASDGMRNCRFIHWGDYDPIGCIEYLRLKRNMPGRVRMHMPDAVFTLVAQHGKRKLIDAQLSVLAELRESERDSTVSALLAMFDTHKKGLEQEALLINANA